MWGGGSRCHRDRGEGASLIPWRGSGMRPSWFSGFRPSKGSGVGLLSEVHSETRLHQQGSNMTGAPLAWCCTELESNPNYLLSPQSLLSLFQPQGADPSLEALPSCENWGYWPKAADWVFKLR